MQILEAHVPRHEAVARKLEAEILLLGQNEKLPTMRQLMGKFQVSQFTVERCLQVLIEKELIEHVPGRGYFARKVDSGNKTSPSNGKTVKIELCFFFKKDTLNNPLYGQISTLMLSEMSSKNCRFNIFAYEEMGCIKEFKKHLQHNRPDVFIMMSCTKVSFQHVLDDLSIPVIHLYSNIEDLNCISYIIDNYRAIKYSIDHLTELGHEKIALLHGQGYDGFSIQAQEERIEAFYSIMAEKKLFPASVAYGGFTYEGGYKAAKKILELPARRRPSAIMCNDYNAGGIYAAINDAGMEVGKDISVIGFDRIREIECLPVKLTTIDIHYAKMVKSIAQKAYALAKGEKYVPEEIRTEVELIIGDSTGPVNIQK